MPETLGRGNYSDEGRIEREAKHPHENGTPEDTLPLPSGHELIAIKEKTQVAISSTLNGDKMSSATSFSHQVELLLQLKQYLVNFQERLLGVSANYQRKIDELHEAGIMEETYYRYVENELAQTQAMIARLVEHIGANDIPKVESEIYYLEQKL